MVWVDEGESVSLASWKMFSELTYSSVKPIELV